MRQENSLEKTVNNPDNTLRWIDIEEQHERVDASRNIYMPEVIIEQYFNRQVYKNSPIKEIKEQFKLLYNKDTKMTGMILIPTHNYDLLRKDEFSANNEIFKKAIEKFENAENLDLIFFRGRYKMTGIPAELRRLGNWFSFKANNEPYLTLEMVRNYVM